MITSVIAIMLIYEDFGSIWSSSADFIRHFFEVFSETFSASDLGTIFIDSGAHFHDFFEVGGARDCERRSFRETSKTLVGGYHNRGPRLPAEVRM